jgi:hypothetical protein
MHGSDFDRTREAIASRGLVATASGYLTGDVASALPFEDLAQFKDLLKRFFSSGPWTDADDDALAALVTAHVEDRWWEHDLGGGIVFGYGLDGGRFVMTTGGAGGGAPSLFDRAFDGPVVPEATPHPRKVRFAIGGIPAPGDWYRRGDSIDDERVQRLFAEPDVTDVMVAGDFVTVGIDRSWEDRLEPILALITELYGGDEALEAPQLTRDELLAEAGHAGHSAADELHLLDPNDQEHQARLIAALDEESASVRRVAVAILAESDDVAVRRSAIERGLTDGSLQVRRMALDAAGDTGDEAFRGALEKAIAEDPDPWSRWRAVKAIGDLGIEPSRAVVEAAVEDDEFRVRFEAERVLRTESQDTSRKTQEG